MIEKYKYKALMNSLHVNWQNNILNGIPTLCTSVFEIIVWILICYIYLYKTLSHSVSHHSWICLLQQHIQPKYATIICLSFTYIKVVKGMLIIIAEISSFFLFVQELGIRILPWRFFVCLLYDELAMNNELHKICTKILHTRMGYGWL